MSIEIMAKAWKQNLGGNDLVVLLCLADFANDEGYCYPARDTIAEKCNISIRTVGRILDKLEEQKLIARFSRKRQFGSDASNGYFVLENLHLADDKKGAKGQNDTPPQKDILEGGKRTFEGGQKDIAMSPLEPSVTISKEKSKKEKLISDYENQYPINEKLESIFLDFIAYRKSIKKPIKTHSALRGFAKNLKELTDLGYTVDFCIEQMKENEWQTIKPDYIKNKPSVKEQEVVM